ncbi:hypothetical protein ACKWTF_007965 [Chironomus riparius]
MSESEKRNRSLTPCLDENRVDDENCADNSKEIELSDISDEDEEWSECNNRSDNIRTNGNNGDQLKESAFKKITRNNRERNYRDNVRRKTDGHDYYSNRSNMRRFDNSRRKEIERYNVRKVIANREFSISRSRSRSFSLSRVEIPSRQPKHSSFSPKRDIYKQSLSPVSRQKRYSPISPRHSSSPDQYRAFPYNRRSLTPQEVARRSRSKHRHTKTRSIDKSLKRRKHKSKDHQHKKHKKSRSKSKRHSSPSLSPEPVLRNNHISPSRQIMNVSNPNLQHQENIRIILKNEDFIKRQKVKKRDKKSKRDKSSRKETRDKISQKTSKEQQPQKKEVFASGDNIVISVCFNNNNNSTGSNNNNVISKDSNNDHNKLKTDIVSEDKLSTKPKSKKRQASPAESIRSNESFDKTERRQRKHKHSKKVKNRREMIQSKEPHTPPMNPPSNAAKRKNDAKPIAIIDLEKSPGKEVTQSPKEVIILSDSDGENKKRDGGNKDIVIIEDTILEKGLSNRNHLSPLREHHTPPESPPLAIAQPGLKFSIKTKSNILPFNLLHDQAEEVEDIQNVNNVNPNTNEQQNIIKQQEVTNNTSDDKNTNNNNNNNNNNLNEAYDPFEPTKSGSTSPITPPPPNEVHSNDINKNSNKLEGLNEKIQLLGSKDSSQIPGLEEHQANQQQPTGSLWNRKEFDKKSSQPLTPPTFAFSSSNASMNKSHIPSLYDGIYGSDLKTPVVPSPIKSNIKPSQIDKSNDDDDDMTPYSPSSDGYGGSNNDYDPPPQTSIHQSKNSFDNIKHSDTQSSEPSASYSFGNDDTPTKTTPLKLTASTLKSFNSTMRTSSLQYVNKAELSIFENYLPASQQKSPLVKRQPNSSFLRTKMSRFTSSMNENGSPHRNISFADSLKPPVIDETMLDDDVPSSAVDLANKDRFLKKSLRIERVAEEVKLVLKPHYNKKHITKEEYKEILRKAVPKICHNKTGEINIQKITQLIEAYIKKVRYKRKSGIASSI